MLDDFATQCVGNSTSSGVAVLLQVVGQFILLAPAVVVAIAFVALDCQTCNTSQNRRCGIKAFIYQLMHKRVALMNIKIYIKTGAVLLQILIFI